MHHAMPDWSETRQKGQVVAELRHQLMRQQILVTSEYVDGCLQIQEMHGCVRTTVGICLAPCLDLSELCGCVDFRLIEVVKKVAFDACAKISFECIDKYVKARTAHAKLVQDDPPLCLGAIISVRMTLFRTRRWGARRRNHSK